jgi:hypothetical protein
LTPIPDARQVARSRQHQEREIGAGERTACFFDGELDSPLQSLGIGANTAVKSAMYAPIPRNCGNHAASWENP